MKLILESFGFRNGIPHGPSFLIDCRGIRNPHKLFGSGRNGLEKEVQDEVFSSPFAEKTVCFANDIIRQRLLQERKQVFHLGIGCTGGHHRSVSIVEKLASNWRGYDISVQIIHRDIDKK